MSLVVAIVGPTAIGKSDLALRLAERFRGEIVSGDSRHVYKYLDIGTNKPSPTERARIPHHLLDIIYPDEVYNLAYYRSDAVSALRQVGDRGVIPYLVGGSGLYIRALLENWQIPAVAPDPVFRASVEEEAIRLGVGPLYQRLFDIDAVEALRIGPTNLRRIIRSLELFRATGITPSLLKVRGLKDYTYIVIGLTVERDELYKRINERVGMMVESGFVDEVRSIYRLGYNRVLPSLSSIGYPEIGRYLEGKITLSQAVELIMNGTHRFARHQYAWFKPFDNGIRWIDCAVDPFPSAEKMVCRFLEENSN